MASLATAFADAYAGRGAAVLIEGDPGIGKTRLLERLRDDIVGDRGRFIRGACYSYLRTPYTPIREAIRSIPGIDLPLRTAKYEAFAASFQTIARISQVAPLVMAIDDLQWADRATLELLDFIIHQVANERILLVCTHRSNVADTAPRVESAIAQLARASTTTIKLGPLSTDETRALLDPKLLALPALGNGGIERIVERAGGNPLFIEEMITGLLQDGSESGRVLPSSLRAHVNERVARLSDDARVVLETASILGSELDIDDLLATVAVSPTRRAAALERALKSGLLFQVSPIRLAFRHSLIRDVIYDSLSIVDARHGHAAIAQRFADRLEGGAIVAYHWGHAGNDAQAAIWNERAGDEAHDVFAYADEAQFFRRAADLTSDEGERPRLLVKAATALQINGDIRAAVREYGSASELYGGLKRIEDQVRTQIMLTSALTIDAGYPAAKREARAAISATRRLADSDLSCNAFATAADSLRIGGYLKRAGVLLHHAALSSGEAGHEALARYHDVAGKHAVGELRDADAAEHFTRSRNHATRVGNVSLIIRVMSNEAEGAQRVLDYDRALTTWREILRLAREREFGWRIPFAEFGLADSLMLRGRLTEAETLVDDALERGLDCATLRMQAAAVGAPLGLLLGRADLVATCAPESTLRVALHVRDSAYLSAVAAAYINIALAQGDEQRAADIARRYGDGAVGAMLSERVLPYVAGYGTDAHFARAERLLREMPPYLALARAMRSKRLGDGAEQQLQARAAAGAFAALGLPLLEAQAAELADERARAKMLRARAGVVADVKRRGRGVDELTPREQEICREVARGDSNREIAARLGISVKTVGHHLESIYARIGVDGRAKLIAHLNTNKDSAA